MNLGFIGLGRMGSGVCKNLIKRGYSVNIFDKDENKMLRFKDSAKTAKNVSKVLVESDLTFLSLPGSVQVEEVAGEMFEAGVKDKSVIDLSTSYPFSSQKLYKRFKEAGGEFADASLTGTPVHAREGNLVTVFGGDEELFLKYEHVLEAFSRKTYYVGPAGSGNIAKLSNNYIAIMYVMLYAEIFSIAEKIGTDTNRLFDIIGNSGVDCDIYKNVGRKIVKKTYEPAFAVELAAKDLSYVKKICDEIDVPSLLLDGGLNILRIAKCEGLGNKDITEAAKAVRKMLRLSSEKNNSL